MNLGFLGLLQVLKRLAERSISSQIMAQVPHSLFIFSFAMAFFSIFRTHSLLMCRSFPVSSSDLGRKSTSPYRISRTCLSLDSNPSRRLKMSIFMSFRVTVSSGLCIEVSAVNSCTIRATLKEHKISDQSFHIYCNL